MPQLNYNCYQGKNFFVNGIKNDEHIWGIILNLHQIVPHVIYPTLTVGYAPLFLSKTLRRMWNGSDLQQPTTLFALHQYAPLHRV